jgi:hypothetical protein
MTLLKQYGIISVFSEIRVRLKQDKNYISIYNILSETIILSQGIYLKREYSGASHAISSVRR